MPVNPANEKSDDDLLLLLSNGESAKIEFKSSFSTDRVRKAVHEAICAFSNNLDGSNGPGVVFIGVDDYGNPVDDFRVDDQLLTQLAGVKSDGLITPPPTIQVKKLSLPGNNQIAAVITWPSDSPPVRYDGRICVRFGPRRGYATEQDERILNERRRYRNYPFDLQPIKNASLDDLDLDFFERDYLPALVARDVFEANGRTLIQKLLSAKFLTSEDDSYPTILSILISGKVPSDLIAGSYTQFLRIEGCELTDPISDELEIHGRIDHQIRMLEDKVRTHNRRQLDFTNRTTEEVSEDYPFDALQQLIRNAYLHRSYEATNAPVRLYWFNDRIEIHNPGGPFGSVTLDNFGTPGLTDYRNPNIAEALRALGFVQRFGVGISLGKKKLGSRLSFQVEHSVVAAIIGKDLP